MSQFGNTGGLSYSIDTHHQYHIRSVYLGLVEPERFGIFVLHAGGQRFFQRFKDIIPCIKTLLFYRDLQLFNDV